MEIDDTEMKRRTRAAWSYSLLEQEDLAGRMDVSHATLRGWLRKHGPRMPLEHALRLADACGVPRAFITSGWSPAPVEPDDPQVVARLARLETQLESLLHERE